MIPILPAIVPTVAIWRLHHSDLLRRGRARGKRLMNKGHVVEVLQFSLSVVDGMRTAHTPLSPSEWKLYCSGLRAGLQLALDIINQLEGGGE